MNAFAKGLTKLIGDKGENASVKYLKKHGYKIISRNFHSAHGEIDIIAENTGFLVFVEVKSRKDNPAFFEEYGLPCEAVDKKKQQHILYTAQVFLQKHPVEKAIRFDVIEVYFGEQTRINHIEDAFSR